MRIQPKVVGTAIVSLSLMLSGSFASAQDKGPPKGPPLDAPPPPEFLAKPESLYSSLRDVINLGARLFNDQGDQAGCYRVYQGGLLAARPYLAENPELLKQVDDALNNAEKLPKINERAFALRTAIDSVREKLQPPTAKKKKTEERVPPPSPETKKKLDSLTPPPPPPPVPPISNPPPLPRLEPKNDEPKKEEAKKETKSITATATVNAALATVAVKLAIKGPDAAKVGESLTFTVSLTNTGDGPLNGVELKVGLTDGLELQKKSQPVIQTSLAAQQTQSFPFTLVAGKTGPQKMTVTVSGNGLGAQAEAVVMVNEK